MITRITSIKFCLSVLLMIWIGLVSFDSYAFDQSLSISGKVIDEDGVPLNGVSVVEKGTDNGTVTDFDGDYSISVESKAVIEFSYLGYKTVEIVVGDETELDVTMQLESNTLDETIVVGYSKTSRKELTSSVSSITGDQIKNMPVKSAAEAIKGRLPGVRVTSSEGGPGGEVKIRVRGGTSITQDNSPLMIVDGVQVEDALSILSPQEIESIEVLKDAASTTQYGARGGNGVILITTKGGKAMPTTAVYSNYFGVRKIVNEIPTLNPYEFVRRQYEIYNLDGSEDAARNFRRRYGTFEDMEIYKEMEKQDWQKEVFGRDAFTQNHNLTVTGGSKKSSFSLSLNHLEEEGIMLNSGFLKNYANFKFSHRINDRFKIDVNTRYSHRKTEGAGTSSTGSQANNRLRNAIRYQPFVGPGTEDFVDEFDPDYNALTNLTSPILLAQNEIQYDNRNDLFLNGVLTWDIIDNLSFKTVFGYVKNDRKLDRFSGSITSVARQNADLPVVDLRTNNSERFTNTNTLTYEGHFRKHRFQALVGQETVKTNGMSERINVKWLPKNITAQEAFSSIQRAVPPEGMVQDPPTTGSSFDRVMSFFGHLHYSFDKRIMATFSIRTDGSSVFKRNNNYSTFPSASVAWNISDENFLKKATWLDNLKLRASYGTSGNNRITPFLYETFYNSSSDNGYAFGSSVVPGLAPPGDLANPNVRWEKSISQNIGLDFYLFNERIHGSIDGYVINTKDLLLRAQIPETSGHSTQFQNSGETRNIGIEFNLGGDIIRRGDFTWSADFNISTNRNKIIKLGKDRSGGDLEYYYETSGWVNALDDFKVEVGKPIGQFYGYETAGFYGIEDFNYNSSTQKYELKDDVPNSGAAALGSRDPLPGDLKLKDLNGDGKIDDDDKTVLGNSQPDFYGGFNQDFSYKNFDLSVFFEFSVGNKVYNANKIENTTQYLYTDNNFQSLVSDSWTNFDSNGKRVMDPERLGELNEGKTMWTPSRGQYILHSFAVEDGSYLRLSNITLGYSLPDAVLDKVKVFSNFRVYFTINNLLTLTRYSGYDPEADTRRSTPLTPGVDYAAYPRSRFFLGGVNISF